MEIGNFGSFFTLFPQKNQANQNFEIMKKIAGDIIILCMCTKKHNHMMYGSSDMDWDTDFLSFCIFFCPLRTRKIKILRKWKKYLEISSFYRWSVAEIFVLCYFLPFNPPKNNPENQHSLPTFSEVGIRGNLLIGHNFPNLVKSVSLWGMTILTF